MTDMTIHLKVSSPWKVLWEGEVVAISGSNADGVFDVLPDHERFLTIVSDTPIEIETTTGNRQTFTLAEALLVCVDNTAHLYTTDTAAELRPE